MVYEEKTCDSLPSRRSPISTLVFLPSYSPTHASTCLVRSNSTLPVLNFIVFHLFYLFLNRIPQPQLCSSSPYSPFSYLSLNAIPQPQLCSSSLPSLALPFVSSISSSPYSPFSYLSLNTIPQPLL